MAMNCPGCSEEIYEDELIDGVCPLCGEKVERHEPKKLPEGREQTVNEILDMFEDDVETVAMTVETEETTRDLTISLEPGFWERVLPKKCAACGRWHLRVGEKNYEIEIEGDEGSLAKEYLCRLCTPVDDE
ncbi:MAG: hypothetical protein ABEK59_13375 [Halobacteria archaeon]